MKARSHYVLAYRKQLHRLLGRRAPRAAGALILAVALAVAALLATLTAHTQADTPEHLLQRALQGARDAGSYQVNIALDQSITPEGAQAFDQKGLHGRPGESAHFEVEGLIGGPGRARFSITPGRTSFAPGNSAPQELLVVNSTVYQWAGDGWERIESAPSMIGIDGDGLSLASVARDVHFLDPLESPPGLAELMGPVRRVGFNLYSDDVMRFMLAQQGQVDQYSLLLARLNGLAISGSGELWIDETDMPTRLVLHLGWVNRDQEPYRVQLVSTADYASFGRHFPATLFDPTFSAETGAPLTFTDHATRITYHASRITPWLLTGALLLALAWLITAARGRSRRASVTVTAILLVALLTPMLVPVADAAGFSAGAGSDRSKQEAAPMPGSQVARMLEETRALASQSVANSPSPSLLLDDMGDWDGDGLPNGYELRLGTNPFSKDTDRDGLTDYEEVVGVPCEWTVAGQSQIVHIETDPLNPDSNYDGLRDGDEYWRGKCSDGSYKFGHAWQDDNDRDGIPDGLDLSPFSSSQQYHGYLGGDQPGANLTFESLDQDPNPFRTQPYPYYVEIQVRPRNADSLRWAYKSLWWPQDHEAAIRHDPVAGALASIFTGKNHISTGEIKLVPFLQATLRERDLPSQTAMAHYGVSASQHKDDQGNPIFENGEALYDMALPLLTVERGGQVFAFQTKMLHDGGGSDGLIRQWRELRLKWAIIGDVLMPDGDGDYVRSPDGGYGLVVYDEPYHMTGLQVSRQGGASMLLAAAIPPSDGRRVDLDAHVALLRAGLEAQFLTGRLNMADIKARFDTPNSASDEERWGIPQDWPYGIFTAQYSHLDAAIATTAMTTTRQVLDLIYREQPDRNLKPTLILASEQRTSVVNLDDLYITDYRDITINTCLKPLVTSRSLKLQTYRWDPTAGHGLASAATEGKRDMETWRQGDKEQSPPHLVTLSQPVSPASHGDWAPLSLDEVLKDIEDQFKSTLSPEELNILKMATTVWHTGMTAVQKLGDLDMQDIANVLSDPEMVLRFLDENGLIPAEYKKVVDVVLDVIKAGGPEAWLQQYWNKAVSVVDAAGDVFTGSFFDVSGEFSLTFVDVEETLLGLTHTALSVLNFLALVTGDSFFTQAAKILTKIIEVYQKIRALWDGIKASIDAAKQGVEVVAQTLAKELGAISKPLSLAGLIIAAGMIWIGLGLTLQFGDFGPTITFTLVLQAIVETILLVVLFVVAAIFPWGTIVAVAIGLIKFIEGLIGFTFDPVSAFFNWLFAVEVKERTKVHDTNLGNLTMEALEPGGGLLAWRQFRLTLPSIITMRTTNGGKASDLNQSWAELHAGRFQAAQNVPVSICTSSKDLWNDYKKALQGYIKQEFSAQNYYCVAFTLPREQYWGFSTSGANLGQSPYSVVSGVFYQRDFLSTAYLDVTPLAAINGKILLDVSYDLWVRYDECSKFGCDEYVAKITTTPAVQPLYFDILPSSLKGLWEWKELFNPDPDGDGLWGYIDPGTGQPVGPDANLCPHFAGKKSWELWDTAGDGLSDKFKLELGLDPCSKDTDGDGLDDARELLIGTDPWNPDTDGDGLSDKQETVFDDGFNLVFPWRVQLSDRYPGLPDPAAFPNPRHPNLDLDHRNDKQEKAKLSSPNAWDPIPIGEPIPLRLSQALAPGGATSISISTPPWRNDEASALNPTLTITLPVTFSNVTSEARLLPHVPWPQYNFGAPQPAETPNVYQWTLPPIWLNRYLQATLTGIPEVPSGPVTVTAELAYTEGDVAQVSTAAAPLRFNAGGPNITFLDVIGAVLLQGLGQTTASAHLATPREWRTGLSGGALVSAAGGPVTVQGIASDPDGVSEVFVCVKTTDTCGDGDWQPVANIAGTPTWSYSFVPPGDNIYYVRAYGVDSYDVAGPVSEPLMIGVDRTPPSRVSFDLKDTVYLSSTVSLGALSIIALTGRVSDTVGAPYVSGVDAVGIVVGNGDRLDGVTVDEPGQPFSTFTYGLETLSGGFGGPVLNPNEVHNLTLVASDVAGNVSTASETLRVLVDDTPPAVYARPPQTFSGDTLTLSGLADDTALLHRRRQTQPYGPGMTLADRDTIFEVGAAMGTAIIVGDVKGDLINDVVLLQPATRSEPFRAGLFFGRPDGFPEVLALADADVIFQGEAAAGRCDFAPTAAGIGDINGDGVGDLLLGDPCAAAGEGRAYVILGRRGGAWGSPFDLSDADWHLSMPGTIGFGGSVAAAGDVNGDGLADFLVGAAGDGSNNGVVWLYLGREQGVSPAIAQLHASRGAAHTPPNLAGLGDVNGNGLSDFLIAPRDAPVALVYGRPDEDWPSDARPTDLRAIADALFEAPGSQQTVSVVGDVNGDGLQDILIGDPEAATPRVFLVYGRRPESAWPAPPAIARLDDVADAWFVEDRIPNSRLGAGLTPLGDLDGDGRADFAFGQPGTGESIGRTALVLTGESLLTREMPVEEATYIISDMVGIAGPTQRSGAYLSAGDVNGDGIPDLLIGALGDNRAYLFRGDFDPGAVSGVARVEIGVYGPVVDPTLPFTQTLPTAWRTAALANPNGAISPWIGEVALSGDGDYRVYARARDRAGNQLEATSWYLGNTWVNSAAIPLAGASATMAPPSLTDQTELTLTGAITADDRIQHLRVFDGYEWHRISPVTGMWTLDSSIPRSDLRTLTFRSVARDAFGATLHASRTLAVDTLLGERPHLSTNLIPHQWQTDLSPTLEISWPAVSDASGIAGTWAVIDTISNTMPTTPAGTNQVVRALSAPGVYYGHVRVQDGAGNEHTSHIGPFPVNRTQTPSLILPDGYLDFAGGEYPLSTLLNYDPYAAFKPAALWGTWDAERLYLGFPGSSGGVDSHLSIYLDTQPGGLSNSLAVLTETHTLPFSADYAFVVGGSADAEYTLYAANAGSWAPVPAPQSFAVTRLDTEIVLDRSEIGATGAVRLLAYAEDSNGVWAVVPGGARPTTTRVITGPIAFADHLFWPGLDDGVEPRDSQDQVIAPIVTVATPWDNVLTSGQTTVITVTVTNPDIAPYENVPLTVEAGPEMALVEASGAPCISCPPGADRWTLAANVAPGARQMVIVQARALGESVRGVLPISVTAELANSGPRLAPQAPARTQYSLDQGVAAVSFINPDQTVYVKPGQAVDLSILVNPELSTFLRCWSQVEANTGAGWRAVGALGDWTKITGELAESESQVWEVRVSGANGRVSEPIARTVVADNVPPTAQISTAPVLSGTMAAIRGTAWDDFPTTRAPRQIEVSINGGRFRPALVSAPQEQARDDGTSLAVVEWLVPLGLAGKDGETIQVVARAIDEAGNVGPSSEPVAITLDSTGPAITITESEEVMRGTVSDGSGVASVEVSLDGGANFQAAALADGGWSFDTASWQGSEPQEFAMVRARDVWGNTSLEVVPGEFQVCSLPHDINNDGIVDILDVQFVASRWRDPEPGAADRNGDEQVTVVDVMLVAADWGQKCPS